MYDDTAGEILATLQAALDSRDLDRMTGLFTPDAVLVGTRRYNVGTNAVREYLREEVVAREESLFWDLPQLDVFLRGDEAIGFSGEGEIAVISPGESEERFPFRLTIVATRIGDRWRIHHFHGSLPSAN
jgi:uncharacterized protein (TIGR02246 family)